VDFTASTTSVDIAVRLGYTNSKVTGTAWFDNITVGICQKPYLQKILKTVFLQLGNKIVKHGNSLATVTVESGTGVNNSKCLKISSLAQDEDVGCVKTLQLAPNSYYKLSALMKYENVTPGKSDGANICLYNNEGEDAIWIRTATATGTNTSWELVKLLF